MQEIGNAGLVKPTYGLGFSPDFIDCPSCRRRQMTQVTMVPSEKTRQAKISYCIGGFWACGLCWFVPDWMRIGYDTQHKCPCGFTVALVRHDQPVGNADYVASRYAADA